jgi:hypothetical protein
MNTHIGFVKSLAMIGIMIASFGCVGTGTTSSSSAMAGSDEKTWAIRAEYIEACSCNLFCICYFQSHPEGDRCCEFSMAVKIHSGHVGDVKVDGEYFWLSGDLGGDFTKPLKGVVITFDQKTAKEKRDAIATLVTKVYPYKFESVKTDEAPITWKKDGLNGHATLGDKGEIQLEGVKDRDGQPTVIKNLNYWGAQKNEGFYLAYGTHHYKGNGYEYSHKRMNGFFITIESSGKL